MDSHSVEEIFDRPWLGVVTSSLASIISILFLPVILPLQSWPMPSLTIIALSILAGVLIQTSQALYFQALSYTESGIVSAYWNTVPATLPIASFLLFGQILTFTQYIGISIIIIGSVVMCLMDGNIEARWKSFLLMVLASLLQVVLILIEDKIFTVIPFLLGFYLITTGLILAGLTPLLSTKVRHTFTNNFIDLRKVMLFFIAIEIINLIALATSQKAIDIGIPSLVTAVEATLPAYTFCLGLILALVYKPFGKMESIKKIPGKLAIVCVMVIGVFLIA